MILDIFSSFDPQILKSAQIRSRSFWVTVIIPLLFFYPSLWVAPRYYWILYWAPVSVIKSQVRRTLGKKIKGFNSIVIPLFILIIISNLRGLRPYVFRHTAHLSITLTYGFPLWLGILLSGFVKSPRLFIAGLLPGGAPAWLNPILVLIETVRISVRPLTLSFRLAANIRAGHIVLGLIGVYASGAIITSVWVFIFLIIIQILYVLFEVGICLIQGYIFCLLLTLYSDDHPQL